MIGLDDNKYIECVYKSLLFIINMEKKYLICNSHFIYYLKYNINYKLCNNTNKQKNGLHITTVYGNNKNSD